MITGSLRESMGVVAVAVVVDVWCVEMVCDADDETEAQYVVVAVDDVLLPEGTEIVVVVPVVLTDKTIGFSKRAEKFFFFFFGFF